MEQNYKQLWYDMVISTNKLENRMEPVIKISVRNLVEFILREGDIDNRAGGYDKEAMQLGNKIHRKIQKKMGSNYHAEVPMKMLIPCDGFSLQLEGRADGVIIEPEKVMIDEIKGILSELERIEVPVPVHLAQAKCYAYMYAVQKELTEMDVQMTYCQMETEEIKRFVNHYPLEELRAWFQSVVGAYEKWARYQIEWRAVRNQSIKEIEFPFAYREDQKELVTSVYRTILRKKKLFIQAPTGVGKTIASIFPAVKAVGEELGEKIFYLTAKTITRTVAEQAFATLKEQHLMYKVITLTAKEKICFCEEPNCNPEYCPYAKGHYDRVNEAVFDLISNSHEMSRERLEAHAKKYQVCPFEMALDVSLWVDAIICDYNYVFDPTAHLKRFFGEGAQGGYLFLIDEAHNLVERAREMYSAALYKEDILEAKRAVKEGFPKLAKRLEECNQLLLTFKRECETYMLHESAAAFMLKVMNAVGELEVFMEECKDEALKEQLLLLYFEMNHFLNMYEKLDENYVIYTELEPGGRFKFKLFCVNPSVNLSEYLAFGNSTVFFSATLLPVQYYKKLLSTQSDDYAVYAKSPFEKDNRLILIGRDVSTKYTMRGARTYQTFAEYLEKIVLAKEGNYLVFFPSYLFLKEVHARFVERIAGEPIRSVVQGQNMKEEEREAFLAQFETVGEESLVGFCVMGGIFSEGIDLKADRLIGAAVIGTGIPQVCPEREILKTYFDAKEGRGFDYAYLYPGMNKVLQAAGRVIRTEEDRGVIMLLDERFLSRQYKDTFPREWEGVESCRITEVDKRLTAFWEECPQNNS